MSTGIPSTLIVKTDSTDSLSVSMSAPTPPYISSVFSNTVIKTDANGNLLVAASSGGSAPDDATYITQTPNATLTNEQALSLLSSGIMRVATTTGVVTALTDSAGIAANISDETGSGFLVFGTLPAITFPNTGVVIRDVGNDHTLTIAPGTDLSANRILTLTTGDAARTITLTGNPTLNDWFDQSVKVASNPTFGNITGGTYNGQTISSVASFTGTMAVAGLATLSGGASFTDQAATYKKTFGAASNEPTFWAIQTNAGGAGTGYANTMGLKIDNRGSNDSIHIVNNATEILTVSAAGLLTVSGAGTHTFGSGASTGIAINAAATAGNGPFFNFNAASVIKAAIGLYSGLHNSTNTALELDAQTADGMNIAATHASGAIRFYSGGTTVRLTMATTGVLLSQLAAGTSASPGWGLYSDHVTNVEVYLGNQAAANRTGVIGWNDTYGYGFLTVHSSPNVFRWTTSDFTKNGTAYTNPDYVFEHWATGQIVQFADREGAAQYDGLRTLADVEALARTTYALPRIADWRAGKAGGNGIFGGGDACLASIEEAYLYLFQHDAIISQLAARIAALESQDN